METASAGANNPDRIHLQFPSDLARVDQGLFLDAEAFKRYSVTDRILDNRANKEVSRPEKKQTGDEIWLPNLDEFRRPFKGPQARRSTVSEASRNPSNEDSQEHDWEHVRQDSCNVVASKGSTDPETPPSSALPLGRTTSYAASHNGFEKPLRPANGTEMEIAVPTNDRNPAPSSCQASAADHTDSNRPSPQPTPHPVPSAKRPAEASIPERRVKQRGDEIPSTAAEGEAGQRVTPRSGKKSRVEKEPQQETQVEERAADGSGEAPEEPPVKKAWSKAAARGAFTAQVAGSRPALPPQGASFLHAPPKPKEKAQLGVSASAAKISSPGRVAPKPRGRPRKGASTSPKDSSKLQPAKASKKGKIGKIRTNLAKKAARGGGTVGRRAGVNPRNEEVEKSNDHYKAILEEEEQGPLGVEELEPDNESEHVEEDEMDDLLMAGLNEGNSGSDKDESVKGNEPPPLPASLPLIHSQQGSAIEQDGMKQWTEKDSSNEMRKVKRPASLAANQKPKPPKKVPARNQKDCQEAGQHLLADVEVIAAKGAGNSTRGRPRRTPKSAEARAPELLQPPEEENTGQQEAKAGKRSRRDTHKDKEYHQADLLNPNFCFYDPMLDREIRDLQPFASTLADGNHLESALTRQQHSWYLANAGKSLEGRQLANLQELQETISREQALYMRVTHKIGAASHADALAHCSTDAKAYVKALTIKCAVEVKALPHHYQLHSNVDLSTVKLKSDVVMNTSIPEGSSKPIGTPFKAPAPGWFFDAGELVPPKTHEGKQLEEQEAVGDARDSASCAREDADTEIELEALQSFLGLLDPDFGAEWEFGIRVVQDPSGKRHLRIGKALMKRKLGLRELYTDISEQCVLREGCEMFRGKATRQGISGEPVRVCSMKVDNRRLAVISAAQSNFVELLESTTSNAPQSHEPGVGADLAPQARTEFDFPTKPADEAENASEAAVSGKTAVVKTKPEHHNQQHLHPKAKEELITDTELAAWWLSMCLWQAEVLWVGRFNVVMSRLTKVERMSSEDITGQANAKQIPPRFASWLAFLLERLHKLPSGDYVMTHAAKSVHASIWKASNLIFKGTSKALPLGGSRGVDAGAVYDLWLAHSEEKPVQTFPAEYVPLAWEPLEEKVPQIPFTFKPRRNIPQRTRKRALQPSFITKRYGADWDEISDRLAPAGGPLAPPKTDVAMYDDL